MSVMLTCKTCGEDFGCYPSQAKAGRQFCSKRCARLDQGRMPEKVCDFCGVYFQPRESRNRFCSVACRAKGCGKENPTKIREARLAQTSAGPNTYRKYHGRHEHRVVAEQTLGRPLKEGEVVHHIDGNKHNNDAENLQVLASQSEHARIHALERHKEGVTA